MSKPYSMDLRERVVRAVTADGMSCHAAASRFGVAPSSAIKWVRRFRDTGSAAPDGWVVADPASCPARHVTGCWSG